MHMNLEKPLKPYKIKKGKESEKESIDLAFYIELALQFCENFQIVEFTTAPHKEMNSKKN